MILLSCVNVVSSTYDFSELKSLKKKKTLDNQGLRAGKGNRTPLPSLGSLYSIF